MADPDRKLTTQMAQAQAGNRAAYREVLTASLVLLKKYFYSKLVRWGGAGAETIDDLAQETLLAVHQARHTFDAERIFEPWLYAIARYKLIDSLRRKRPNVSIDHKILQIADSFSALEQFENQQELDYALKDLPEKQRRLVEMVRVENLSIREVATRMGMNESAVKVAVHRAVKSVQKRLGVQS